MLPLQIKLCATSRTFVQLLGVYDPYKIHIRSYMADMDDQKPAQHMPPKPPVNLPPEFDS